MRPPKGDLVLKICSAGSYQVGKTSLIRRYAENKFSMDYMPTIGVDITTKRVEVDDNQIKLLLVDTAGQEFFGKIRQSYFVGALGCLFVYDVTRSETFTDLNRWISDFRSVAGEEAFITIIGNKKDLEESRIVTYQEGKDFADQYGAPFYECSAKLGGGVIPEIYQEIAGKYLALIKEKET